MKSRDWLLWGGLGTVGAVLLWDQVVQSELPEYGCSGARNQALTQELAMKWGAVFSAPTRILMVLARIESGFRPNCYNLNPRAIARGGAWGLVQQTLDTAKGHARNLASHWSPDVQQTLARFDGTGKSLLDPDLNMMFAAYHVGGLVDEFGEDLRLIAGAYHQGAGKIRQMLRDRKSIPEELPPNGKKYVTAALKYDGELFG